MAKPRSLTVCNQPGCPTLTTTSHCLDHARKAWAGSTRRARLPRNWPTLRARVLQRDSQRCTHHDEHGHRCPARATDVHHLNGDDNHTPSNLASLCSAHHATETGRQGNAARIDR